MILTIDYNENSFMGRTYFYAGLSDGFIGNGPDYEEEKRLYFNGVNKNNCLYNAISYCDTLKGSNKSKLKILLNQIKSKWIEELKQ